MFVDELLGARDDGRLGVFLLHHHLVADHREVLRKDGQQLDDRLVLPGVQHAGAEIGLSQRGSVRFQTPFRHQLYHAIELRLRRFAAKDLAGLQKADQTISRSDRHRRVT